MVKEKSAESAILSRMEEYIQRSIHIRPRTAVILGSGLGHFADSVDRSISIPYETIPFYPKSSVEGHSGELVGGTIGSEPVLIASGRFHLYEGYDMDTVTLPIRLFRRLGISNLVITNASGSLRKDFSPGTLMGLKGYIDFTFRESANLPETEYYSPRLLDLAEGIARREGIELKRGTYAWTLGPSFETPAEIRLIRELGGDAVGMSTVPEIRAALDLGLDVLGISCLTNYAAGITTKPLTHQEVMDVAKQVSAPFTRLLKGIIIEIGKS